MNTINRDDLIYLAGLIDGDGSLIAQIVRRGDYQFQFQIRLTLQITQLKKRKHFLQEVQQIIGAGTIRDRGNVSDYVLTEARLVYSFLKQLSPFLRMKQKQANLVIRILEQLPSSKKSALVFVELCRISDQVAELNDSGRRDKVQADGRTITADVVETYLKELKII